MIVLDTNVVSEAMKAKPNSAVRAWLDGQAAETLYTVSHQRVCGITASII